MAGSEYLNATAFTYNAANARQFKTFTLDTWAVITYTADSNVVYSGGGPLHAHKGTSYRINRKSHWSDDAIYWRDTRNSRSG